MAAAGSWIEQGPMITSRRSDLPCRIWRSLRRVSVTSASTGVPWIGKKRIRCSGGGSGMIWSMRSSSVSEVLSSMGWVMVYASGRKKKTARLLALAVFWDLAGLSLAGPFRQMAGEVKEKAEEPARHGFG